MSTHAAVCESIRVLSESLEQFAESWAALSTSTITGSIDESKPKPDEVLARIVQNQEHLNSQLELLEEHQVFQEKITSAQAQVADCSAKTITILMTLRTAEERLETLLAKLKHQRQQSSNVAKGNVDYKEIVAYAHRLAKYTSPPPPGAPVMYPPIPQDVRIKRSLLFQQDSVSADAVAADTQHKTEALIETDAMFKLRDQPSLLADEGDEEDELDLGF